MKVLLEGRFDATEREAWAQALAAAAAQQGMSTLQFVDSAAARADPQAVCAAVVANPAPGVLQGWPALGLIQSLWAGVDRLLDDGSLPAGVPIARMVDPAMNAAMAETALWAVIALHRGFFAYALRQRQAQWQAHGQQRADEVPVLVLGAGEMGQTAGRAIASLGYPLRHWRRDGTPLPGLLAEARIVVNLLPLTRDTRDLIDACFLAALPRDACLVNLARGAHVVEADLLAALDSGHLRHAVLDVFRTEPLPPTHPFWRHPRITVLPHAAAQTDWRSAARVAVANLRALRDGAPIAHLVERGRGY